MSIYLEFTRLLLIFLWWMPGLGSPLHLGSNQLYNSTQKRMKHPEVAQWTRDLPVPSHRLHSSSGSHLRYLPSSSHPWCLGYQRLTGELLRHSMVGMSSPQPALRLSRSARMSVISVDICWLLKYFPESNYRAKCDLPNSNKGVISQIVIRVWKMWRLLDS